MRSKEKWQEVDGKRYLVTDTPKSAYPRAYKNNKDAENALRIKKTIEGLKMKKGNLV